MSAVVSSEVMARPSTPPTVLAPAPSPGAIALSHSSSAYSVDNASGPSPRRSFSERVPVTYPADIAPSSPQRSPQRTPRSSTSPSRPGSLRSKASPVAVRPALAMIPPSPTVLTSLNTEPSSAQLSNAALARQSSSATIRGASPAPGASAEAQRTSSAQPQAAAYAAPSLRARCSAGSIFSDCSASTMPSSPGLPPSYLCSVQPR